MKVDVTTHDERVRVAQEQFSTANITLKESRKKRPEESEREYNRRTSGISRTPEEKERARAEHALYKTRYENTHILVKFGAGALNLVFIAILIYVVFLFLSHL